MLFVVARRIVDSPFGDVAPRDSRQSAARRAVGIPVRRRLVAIYTIAAAYAGVAGALLAQTTQFVSLDALAFDRSADVLLVLVIGGTGWLYGGLVGALVFKIAQDVFSGLTPQYWHFWIGLVLVVLVLIGRERCASGAADRGAMDRAPPRDGVATAARTADVTLALETVGLCKSFGGLTATDRRVVPARAGRAARADRARTAPARRRSSTCCAGVLAPDGGPRAAERRAT